MLTIHNIDNITGTEIQTTHAMWSVTGIEERKNDYIIRVRFNYGTTPAVKHPKWVSFKLLRYNEFDSTANEWRMYNDQSNNSVTLTKGLLSFKMFPGMLGGQLDTLSNTK